MTPASGAFTTLTTTGSVGLGVASPSAKLHVAGAAILEADATGITGGQLLIRGAGNTSQQTWLGYDTADNVGVLQSFLQGTGAEPLALQPNGGDVAIGTTSPIRMLHIVSAGSTGLARFETQSDTVNAVLELMDHSPSHSRSAGVNFLNQAGSAMGQIAYDLGNNSLRLTTNAADRLHIDSNGYVGIGTSTPAALLDVGGNVKINGSGAITVYARATPATTTLSNSGNYTYLDGQLSLGGPLLIAASGRSRRNWIFTAALLPLREV